MSTVNYILFNLVAPNIPALSEITDVRVSIRDDRMFLYDSVEQTHVPAAILEREQVHQTIVGVFMDYVYKLEGYFRSGANSTRGNLLRDAFNASDLDYRFSTKDAPDIQFNQEDLLHQYRRLRIRDPSSDVVELNLYLWQCDAAKILRDLLNSDDSSVASGRSRVSMTGSRQSHKSSKPRRLISPVENPSPSLSPPASMHTLKQMKKDTSALLKNAVESVRSSLSKTRHRNKDTGECSSQMSGGSDYVHFSSVPPPVVDVPVHQVSPLQSGIATSEVKSSGHQVAAPLRNTATGSPLQTVWRENHVIDTSPLHPSDNGVSEPLKSPVPISQDLPPYSMSQPVTSHSAAHSSNSENLPTVLTSNYSEPLQNIPVTTSKNLHRDLAFAESGSSGGWNGNDDQKSVSRGEDECSELGVLYYDPSKTPTGGAYPHASSLVKFKNYEGRILLGDTWECYIKPCFADFHNAHPPWIGWHSSKGHLLSFPVIVGNQCETKANYLRHFKDVTYDPTTAPKRWSARFPTFPKNADLDTIPIFHFVQAVVKHCYNHNVYCPPIHTVNKLEPRGWWYNALPSSTQHLVETYWSPLLHTHLSDTKTGLVAHPQIRNYLNGSGDGYVVLVQLLALARHPRLTMFSAWPPKPTQGQMSLLKYFNAWQERLLIETVRGVTPSDRGYVYWIVNGLHPSMHKVGERVINSMEREKDDKPLPMTFAPCYLYELFSEIASSLGVSTAIRPRSSDDTDAVDIMHALHNGRAKKPPKQIIRTLTTNKGNTTKQTKPPRKCYLCDDDHIIRDCPHLPEARHQLSAGAAKMVRQLLEESDMSVEESDNLIRSIFTQSGIGAVSSSDASVANSSDDDASVASDAKTVFQ